LEHRWGRLVFELGLGSTGATLATYNLVLPRVVNTNEKVTPGWFRRWVLPPADTPDAAFVAVEIPDQGVPRFPYQTGFEPDADL